MIAIKIKPFMGIRKAMDNAEEIDLDIEDPVTLKEMLNKLSRKYGDNFRKLIFDETTDQIKDHYNILVNGRQYQHLPEQLDTRLNDGDIVSLFPPAGGG
ncbi:MAG: MoaD/ThiS family protein [Thermodesulfobacteriota bacterium]|nr:MoaD/ThiS family protein [Thermodesulfobacteriota bacterium]